jgi:serine/threonine protein phosphatase PrpC
VFGDEDVFCEACGTPLPGRQVPAAQAALTSQPDDAAAAEGCPSCGAAVADGWCTVCGAKARDGRDHFEVVAASWVAGVCDVGVRHTTNEDAMAFAVREPAGTFAALVVCDGVTTAPGSDVAAIGASAAAAAVLDDAGNTAPASVAARTVHYADALVRAASAASAAATAADVAAAEPRAANPPSCTFVATVLHDGLLVSASVGDSRTYWLGDDGVAVALTVDDSVAAAQIAAGTPRLTAEAGPQGHAITAWLGADAPPLDVRPGSWAIDGHPGWLLVCSDGMWNYASEAGAIADVVRTCAAAAGDDPLETARALVAWANEQGGDDNITAALARVPGTSGPAPSSATD